MTRVVAVIGARWEPNLERELLATVRVALDRSGFWDELHTNWVCLDCELMPWSAKAMELVRQQYAAVGTAARVGLGESVATARAVASLGAILLCGATTAICGPIGFLGLVVPHLCRLLIGVDHRWLLPFSTLAGACLLLPAW